MADSELSAVGTRLIRDLRRALQEQADPDRAVAMRAYMKSTLPFYGVPAPQLRAIWREVLAAHPLRCYDDWRTTALVLWRGARFREERHSAIALTGHRAYAEYQMMKTLPMYEEMIVTGAWWDYVDSIAPTRLGALLRKYRPGMSAAMRRWSRSRDMWKRRSAILCQLKMKADTDLSLLYDCIRESWDSREFFLRKAIGWALREYARTDPREVRRFVAAHESSLSNLSRREALKHLG